MVPKAYIDTALPVGSRVGSVIRQLWSARYIYLALIPTFGLIGLFMVYPTIQAFITSTLEWEQSNYNVRTFIGLGNYMELLHDKQFLHTFPILIFFMAWGFTIPMFFSIAGAYLVYLLGHRRLAFIMRTAFVVPMVIPLVVGILYWRFFYEPNIGLLNTMLDMLGLSSWKHVWLADSQVTAIGALAFVGFPWISSLNFLILLAGFQNISLDLHEAARIDGASGWQVFSKIDLPLVIPQLKLLVILGMIGGIQQYGLQYILTQGGPGYDTTVPGLYMFNNAFAYGRLGYGAAIGVVLFILIMIATILNLKFIRKRD